MEKFLAQFPGQKFNLFLGEEFLNIHNTGISRKNLCSFFFDKLSPSTKAKIQASDCFSEVSQKYLETVLFSRKRFLEYIEEYSRQASSLDAFFEKLIQLSSFSSLFSLDAFLNLDSSFEEKIDLILPLSQKEHTSPKIRYYRISGSLSDSENLFITAQDLKRLKVLDFYQDFWKNIRKEFCERATLLYHVPLQNKDYQDILSFILEEIRLDKKAIYALSSETVNSETLDFLKRYQIQVLSPKDLEKEEKKESSSFPERQSKESVSPIGQKQGLKIEDNTEIQLSSLQLHKLPIRYKNFSTKETLQSILPLGSTNIHVGDKTLHHVNLKAMLYQNFRLLEFKTKEFQLTFSVELFDDAFFLRENYLQYSFEDGLMNERYKNLFEIFEAIFRGENIRFQYRSRVSELQLSHPAEALKLSMLHKFIERYEKLPKRKMTERERRFHNFSGSFYELELFLRYLEGQREYAGWMNARIPTDLLQDKEEHCLERIFHYSFRNFPRQIKQSIYFTQDAKEHEGESIQLNRKNIKICLEAVEETGD